MNTISLKQLKDMQHGHNFRSMIGDSQDAMEIMTVIRNSKQKTGRSDNTTYDELQDLLDDFEDKSVYFVNDSLVNVLTDSINTLRSILDVNINDTLYSNQVETDYCCYVFNIQSNQIIYNHAPNISNFIKDYCVINESPLFVDCDNNVSRNNNKTSTMYYIFHKKNADTVFDQIKQKFPKRFTNNIEKYKVME